MWCICNLSHFPLFLHKKHIKEHTWQKKIAKMQILKKKPLSRKCTWDALERICLQYVFLCVYLSYFCLFCVFCVVFFRVLVTAPLLTVLKEPKEPGGGLFADWLQVFLPKWLATGGGSMLFFCVFKQGLRLRKRGLEQWFMEVLIF